MNQSLKQKIYATIFSCAVMAPRPFLKGFVQPETSNFATFATTFEKDLQALLSLPWAMFAHFAWYQLLKQGQKELFFADTSKP